MKFVIRLALIVAVCRIAMPAAPAAAQTASVSPPPMMNVDCAKAGDTMTASGKASEMPAMTGDVDKDFSAMAMMHMKAMMMLMQVEAKCGKDPKLKAAASQRMQDSLSVLEMLQALGHTH